jgi:monothiol glutaredoxin
LRGFFADVLYSGQYQVVDWRAMLCACWRLRSCLFNLEFNMPRPLLDDAHIHSAIRNTIATHQQAIVREVQVAIASHAVVVVGMGMNPFPKKARSALDAAGVPHHDLDYGNYFSKWRERNALKMWTGWPTLPMVFVGGTLVGGANDLNKLIATGELKAMLAGWNR